MQNYDNKITDAFGNTTYTLNGKLHRTDGPAVEWVDGYRAWWFDGKLHRVDGPAVVHADGDRAWYLNGYRLCDGDPVVVEKNEGSFKTTTIKIDHTH